MSGLSAGYTGHDITALLVRVRTGDSEAERVLLPLVYAELRRLAGRQMVAERSSHTLQPTALVHEAFVRIFRQMKVDMQCRAHFFSIAAKVMRQILVDYARGKQAAKRGGHWQRLSVDDVVLCCFEKNNVDILALDAALERLATASPRACRVVELLFFAGLDISGIAGLLDVSERTVKRDWAAAKAWLHKEIYGTPGTLGTFE